MKARQVFLLGTLFSLQLLAKSDVFFKSDVKQERQACPLVINANVEKRKELSKSWESLPTNLLIAKAAHFTVDAENFHAESFQNFVNPSQKEKSCVLGEVKANQFFSIMAPTLVDLTAKKETGSRVWTFQLFADGKEMRSVNSLSRVASNTFNIEKMFKEQGLQEKYYRLSGNEYEIIATKVVDGKTLTLSVIFEIAD